jgi:hypothetical protein
MPNVHAIAHGQLTSLYTWQLYVLLWKGEGDSNKRLVVIHIIQSKL